MQDNNSVILKNYFIKHNKPSLFYGFRANDRSSYVLSNEPSFMAVHLQEQVLEFDVVLIPAHF